MPAKKPNSGGGRPAIPGKLAPGMRLPRELVAESQRARLGIALVELVDAQGFAGTSLADLTARAHVARAAFYEHFGGMEGCFVVAYDEHLARAAGQLVSAYNAPGMEDGERAGAGLGALAAFAQVWPAAARVCLGDVLTVAHGTVEAREQLTEAACALLDSALGADGAHATHAPALVTGAVGAIRRALYVHLRERPARELSALAEQLLDWVLVYAHAPLPAERSGEEGQGANAGGKLDAGGTAGGDLGGADALAADDGPKERILAAMLKLASEKAGESISLAEIAASAGVSFGTFYKHFETSHDALLGACEAVHERLIDRARAAYAVALGGAFETGASSGDPAALDGAVGAGVAEPESLAGSAPDHASPGRLTSPGRPVPGDTPPDAPGPGDTLLDAPTWATAIAVALGAYLAAAAAEPAATRVMVLGSLGLGRPGLAFLDRRADALKQLLGPGLRAHPGLPSASADMLAGAILELVHEYALRDELERLPELHEQLSYIVLTPLLAPHAAAAHAEHPLERPHASPTLAAKRTRARR